MKPKRELELLRAGWPLLRHRDRLKLERLHRRGGRIALVLQHLRARQPDFIVRPRTVDLARERLGLLEELPCTAQVTPQAPLARPDDEQVALEDRNGGSEEEPHPCAAQGAE